MAWMIERTPCVYILASGYNGRLYTGVTSNLIERENPAWNDLAVSFGLEPLTAVPAGPVDPAQGRGDEEG